MLIKKSLVVFDSSVIRLQRGGACVLLVSATSHDEVIIDSTEKSVKNGFDPVRPINSSTKVYLIGTASSLFFHIAITHIGESERPYKVNRWNR